MKKEDVFAYVLDCSDQGELQELAKLAWGRLKELDSTPLDLGLMFKLRLAKRGSILKLKWRGKGEYEAEFERLYRTTVSAFVREMGKSYRFPIRWVTDVEKPDGKRFFSKVNDEPRGRLHRLET